MPMNYQFLQAGQPISMNTIDDEMRADRGLRPDPQQYCNLFRYCEWIGPIPRLHVDGKLSREKLVEYLANPENGSYTDQEKALIVKYLCDKYQFSAWYSR